jgi:mRNA-degrading endonuclease RelE of RelBE toxin-antitoxin system
MTYSLKLLRPARKELDKLDNRRAEKVHGRLVELKKDPYRPRPGMDIRPIEGKKKPPAYRLRIGRLRLEYVVLESDGMIVIFDAFVKKRASDYR